MSPRKMESLEQPIIPAKFSEPSTLESLVVIFYAVALALIPGFLARGIWLTPLPLVLQVLIILPLIGLAGHGVVLIGCLGHDATAHFSLHRNKFVNILIGLLITSPLISFLEIGLAVSHGNHHRFTNQASDPNCHAYNQCQTFWSKLFLARFYMDWGYLKNALGLAFNQPLPFRYYYPYRGEVLRGLAWANIGLQLLWIAIYGAVIFYYPLIGIFVIILPLGVSHFLMCVQAYMEHAGTENQRGRDTRSRTALLFTILYAGSNYHLEHHLYPTVPCYRLPALHQFLKKEGFYERVNAFIEPSILGAYKSIDLPYPQPESRSSQTDSLISV